MRMVIDAFVIVRDKKLMWINLKFPLTLGTLSEYMTSLLECGLWMSYPMLTDILVSQFKTGDVCSLFQDLLDRVGRRI